jgi:hypothetical protein
MRDNDRQQDRRRFLTLVGGGTVLLPLAGLVACSSEEPGPPTIAANQKDAAPTRPDPATPDTDDSAPPTQESEQSDPASQESAGDDAAGETQMASNDSGGGGSLPRLSEDDSQAKSLSYKHIASDVDSSKQPRYKEGQQCSNCQVYQGKDGEEWGPCPIFAGKAVKATGWCTAYSPMSA